eukprot:149947_1
MSVPSEPTVKLESPAQPCGSIAPTWTSAAFRCEFCDKEFNLKGNLVRHVTESHQLLLVSSVKSEETFSVGHTSLNQSHGNQRDMRPESREVSNTFADKSSDPSACDKENSVHHGRQSDARSFQCHFCDFQCHFCEKSFKIEIHLKHHERSHNDEKAFQCSLCDKSFKSRGSLRLHHKSHSDERP